MISRFEYEDRPPILRGSRGGAAVSHQLDEELLLPDAV
jgi:hypothetical protein